MIYVVFKPTYESGPDARLVHKSRNEGALRRIPLWKPTRVRASARASEHRRRGACASARGAVFNVVKYKSYDILLYTTYCMYTHTSFTPLFVHS